MENTVWFNIESKNKVDNGLKTKTIMVSSDSSELKHLW